jgi:hypothetical protein
MAHPLFFETCSARLFFANCAQLASTFFSRASAARNPPDVSDALPAIACELLLGQSIAR